MTTESKLLIGVGVFTLILIVVGVFFFAGKQQPSSQTSSAKADSAVLLSDTKHSKGNPNAPVKIVEFSDFQCPACGAAYPVVKKVVEANKDKVFFVYRYFPLPIHKNGRTSAEAAEAAGMQGKFWEMHDMLFENQQEWSESNDAQKIFEGYAQKLGLGVTKYKEDLSKTSDPIAQGYSDGNKSGVDSTPTFFVNGEKHAGALPESQMQDLINKASTSK